MIGCERSKQNLFSVNFRICRTYIAAVHESGRGCGFFSRGPPAGAMLFVNWGHDSVAPSVCCWVNWYNGSKYKNCVLKCQCPLPPAHLVPAPLWSRFWLPNSDREPSNQINTLFPSHSTDLLLPERTWSAGSTTPLQSAFNIRKCCMQQRHALAVRLAKCSIQEGCENSLPD